MRSVIPLASLVPLVVFATSPLSAQMQEGSGEGTVTYIPAVMETSDRADGTMLQFAHMQGLVTATDTAIPFHMSSQDCVGANVATAEGMLVQGHGACYGVDTEGDVWWIWYSNNPDGGTWGFLGGTGKYEGIEGGGTTQSNLPTAEGRLHVAWQGTWQMK